MIQPGGNPWGHSESSRRPVEVYNPGNVWEHLQNVGKSVCAHTPKTTTDSSEFSEDVRAYLESQQRASNSSLMRSRHKEFSKYTCVAGTQHRRKNETSCRILLRLLHPKHLMYLLVAVGKFDGFAVKHIQILNRM